MKISVIVPLFNGQKTIKETLDSILGQTHQDLEVLVIDDGSTDSGAELVKKIKDPRLSYVYQKNSGQPSVPRNAGIKQSTGDFIAFCDQDDIWYSKKIETQLNGYHNSQDKEEIGFIFATTDVINNSGKVIGTRVAFTDGFLEQGAAFDRLILGCIINNCSTMVPKKVLDKVGLLDENLKGNDDYDLWLRITQKYGIYGIVEPLCAWRDTGENLSGIKSTLYLENEKVFSKLLKSDPNNKTIRQGYSKNINRVMVGSVLEENQDLAIEYAQKAKKAPGSLRGKIFAHIYLLAPSLTTMYLKNAAKRGKISL